MDAGVIILATANLTVCFLSAPFRPSPDPAAGILRSQVKVLPLLFMNLLTSKLKM